MNIWETVKLADIGEFRNGVNFESAQMGEGYPLVNVKDITNHHFIKQTELDRVAIELKGESESFSKRGDLFFVRSSVKYEGSGEVALLNEDNLTGTIHCGFVIRFRTNSERVEPLFLLYCLRSKWYRESVRNLASGATIYNISQMALAGLKVSLPPLPAQRRIAEILGRYDELIENYNRQIGILESTAQNIYREWFIRGRCPYAVYEEDSKMPVDWSKKTVEDCFEILGGGTPSKEELDYWEDGTINWFTPTDITANNGVFLERSVDRITELGLEKSSARRFPPYSVMMTSRATIGAIAINTEPATTNQGFIVCLPNDQFSFAFIYYWILYHKHVFEIFATGSTFLEISKSVFKEIEVVVPSDNVVREFDKKVLPIFAKIENLQKQIGRLRGMRDKLLPRLLSGKLPVSGKENEEFQLDCLPAIEPAIKPAK